MKNIGGRYNKKENIENNKFIKEYTVRYADTEDEESDDIVVTFSNRKQWAVPTSNYSGIIDNMENQARHQVVRILPIVKKDETIDIIGTVVTFTACALCATGETFGLNLKEETVNALQIALGTLSAAGLTLTLSDIIKIINIKKYELFLEKKDNINSTVRESHNLLSGASLRAKKAICNDTSDSPINYGNIDCFSKDDIIQLSENVDTQNTLRFVFDDPITDKQLR